MARTDPRRTERRPVQPGPRIALTREEIHALAPYLVEYWKTSVPGRRVVIDRDVVTIRLAWYLILFRVWAKVRFGKLKGQPIPHRVDIPMTAIEVCRWRQGWGPFRHRLLLDAPGYNNRWCWAGLRGGERPYRLKAAVRARKRERLAWVAAAIYYVCPALRPPRQPGFPKLKGSPEPRRRPGVRVVSMREDQAGRRRRADPRRRDGTDWRRTDSAGRPLGRLMDAGLADVQMRAAVGNRRRRRT